MDMEHELRALRIQIREKSIFSFKLQKEVCTFYLLHTVKSHIFFIIMCNHYELLSIRLEKPILKHLVLSPFAPKQSEISRAWNRFILKVFYYSSLIPKEV